MADLDYKSVHTGTQLDRALQRSLNPDTSPKSGSSELITSGGVKHALEEVDKSITKVDGKLGDLALEINDKHKKVDEKGFFLIDANDKIAAQYTKDGFDVAKLSAHFKSLVKAIEGIGLVIGESIGTAYDGKKGKDMADALTRLTGVVQDLKNVIASVSERGFFFTDSSDLVGFKYDANGFDAAKVSSHFKSLVGSGGGGGGLSENAKTLLIQILQSGVYVNAESNDKINKLLVELNK